MPFLFPWQVCAAATWIDCQCPWDVGDYHDRDCCFPECQLSDRDSDAGHDPRNYFGVLVHELAARERERRAKAALPDLLANALWLFSKWLSRK